MACDALTFFDRPQLEGASLVMSMDGWMDGGEVSTGTVEWLIDLLGATPFAQVEPDPFYIFNFPGDMEVSAVFRPHTKIVKGLIEELGMPTNRFYCSPDDNLVLFAAKEPNLRWTHFADCFYELLTEVGVKDVYFIGSVAGASPHTREPRVHCSTSAEEQKEKLESVGVRFSQYEGPASFVTYLTSRAQGHGVRMAGLVAEVPAYLEGRNPKSIETMVRKLCSLLGLTVELAMLRQASDDWERRVNEAVETREDLAEHIKKLESEYDDETFDTELGHVKDWLEQKGIRLD
jgi:predicted ATP-grasp superfamily ATP-dependent carboligase